MWARTLLVALGLSLCRGELWTAEQKPSEPAKPAWQWHVVDADDAVHLNLFWSKTCPHCPMARAFQQTLENLLRERDIARPVEAMLTRVVVRTDDPLMRRPAAG